MWSIPVIISFNRQSLFKYTLPNNGAPHSQLGLASRELGPVVLFPYSVYTYTKVYWNERREALDSWAHKSPTYKIFVVSSQVLFGTPLVDRDLRRHCWTALDYSEPTCYITWMKWGIFQQVKASLGNGQSQGWFSYLPCTAALWERAGDGKGWLPSNVNNLKCLLWHVCFWGWEHSSVVEYSLGMCKALRKIILPLKFIYVTLYVFFFLGPAPKPSLYNTLKLFRL